MVDDQKRTICICGHPISRHELVGTEYARCNVWKNARGANRSGHRCACQMRALGVVVIGEEANTRGFRRASSGAQTPHALTGALEGVLDSQITWLTDECWDCRKTVDHLNAAATDKNGEPWIGSKGYASSSIDVGTHVLLCGDCYQWWAQNQAEDHLRV